MCVTYSLLICDVQLWLGVRFELVLFESCVDPSILHDLLQQQIEAVMLCVTLGHKTTTCNIFRCLQIQLELMLLPEVLYNEAKWNSNIHIQTFVYT